MNRQEKEALVSELSDRLRHSNASFLISVQGLTVSDLENIRKDLHNSKGSLKVAKVRLMKLAVKGIPGAEQYSDHLREQLAVVFANEEPTSVAKILHNFSKENSKLSFVGGCFESKFLEKKQVEFIATLPSREVLLAQILGILSSPIVKLLIVLKQLSDKKS